MNRRGFTLIEILISITILASLSMLAARTIQQAVRAKVKLQGQIDDVSRVRDAMRLFERDVNLAYHHRDFEQEILDAIKGKPKTPPGAAQPAPPPPPEAERRDPNTYWIGNEEALSFVTMNNARMIKNSRTADFLEVGYALKGCRSSDAKRSSKCLWRRSSPIVDDQVDKGGDEIVLLEDVSEFSIQYIGKGKQDWVKDWRSDKGGDAVTKDKFPQAVQLSLTVVKGEGDKKKTYKMQIVASVHFPNNKEDEPATNTQGSGGGTP
jgi:prepilin-type N-terminal cleavage/methylation domain-containing protein